MNDAARWDGAERRKNPRLRRIIDELQAGVRENREAIAALSHHFFQLKEQIDTMRTPVEAPRITR